MQPLPKDHKKFVRSINLRVSKEDAKAINKLVDLYARPLAPDEELVIVQALSGG